MKGSVGDGKENNLKPPIKILVVNFGPVYPVRAMNQMRTHNMIQTLARDFAVDLAAPVNREEERNVSIKALAEVKGFFHDLGAAKPKNNLLKKRSAQLKEYLAYYLAGYDREYIAYKSYQNNIINLIQKKNYSIVISNYWEGSSFFRKLDQSVFKILDPHYAVGENWEVFRNKKLKGLSYWFEYRRLRRNAQLEKTVIKASDLLLPISRKNLEEFEKIAPEKPMVLIADGSDVELYASFPVNPDPNTILFYGAMSSAQNINAFKRFYQDIYPALKWKLPELRLLIVGNKPTAEIKKLHNGKDIIVTGFVDDVRPWLAQAWIKIIPLELGSGFRGRVVELMAMGIPVIGTHNALDSIGMENGIHGFISDSDEEMKKYCLELLNNHHLRQTISLKAVAFVKEHYSLNATFGKLNEYLIKKRSQ